MIVRSFRQRWGGSLRWALAFVSMSLPVVGGCGGSQTKPTAEDTKHTEQMIKTGPTAGMPGSMSESMLKGGSPEEQVRRATGGAGTPTGPAGAPPTTP